jgi:hypothetical protein
MVRSRSKDNIPVQEPFSLYSYRSLSSKERNRIESIISKCSPFSVLILIYASILYSFVQNYIHITVYCIYIELHSYV